MKKILLILMSLLLLTFASAMTMEERVTALENRVAYLELMCLPDTEPTPDPTPTPIACYNDLDCGVSKVLPNECSGNYVMSVVEKHECVNEGTSNSMCETYLGKNIYYTCMYGCTNGACNPAPTCKSDPIKELTVDYNGDGKMECFTYYNYWSTYTNRYPIILGKTKDGFDIHRYIGDSVIVNGGNHPIYKLGGCCATSGGNSGGPSTT